MDIYIRERPNTLNKCQVCGVKLEVEITLLDKENKAAIIRLCSGCRYKLYNELHEFHMKKIIEKS